MVSRKVAEKEKKPILVHDKFGEGSVGAEVTRRHRPGLFDEPVDIGKELISVNWSSGLEQAVKRLPLQGKGKAVPKAPDMGGQHEEPGGEEHLIFLLGEAGFWCGGVHGIGTQMKRMR